MLINPHAVIGYPKGMQTTPVRLRLPYPAGWTVGTALERGRTALRREGLRPARRLPDLLGRLTTAQTRVTGVPIEIYTFSKTGLINPRNCSVR